MRPDIPTDSKDVSYRHLIILAAVVFAALTVVFLPFVQSVLYRLVVASPGLVQWTVVAAIIAAIGVMRGSRAIMYLAVAVFIVMGLVVGPIASGIYAHTDMANQMQQDATELDTLPNTSKENVRVLPRSVADNYAQSSVQYTQHGISESDIAYVNGSYVWSYAIQPDNLVVSLLGNQIGTMYVDMTTTNKQTSISETEFQNGRGQMWFDAYTYQSVLKTPLKAHNWETTFNAESNGQSYIAHSTTTHEWKFRLGPIPQFYAVPQHGSVEVMHPDGNINSLSPQQAQNSELLRGQNFYPYHLSMFKVRSMQYVHGPLNRWFSKEDVLAIADLPEGGNSWPIVVPTEESSPGTTYFVATEPAGSGNGVYEVWAFDGQSGKAGVQQYDDSQIGPQKAVDFVERRQEINRLSNANAVAPIPIVKGDSLFWHVKVVPKSESGVIYTAFVNATNGDVTLVEGTQPIYAFLTQDEVQSIQNQTEDQEGGMTVTVVVTDENGEIVGTRNITAPKGGGIQVDVQSRASNNSTAQESESA